MLEDLLGREVTVSPADPVVAKDLPTTVVALYVDSTSRLSAVLGLELSLAAYAGAALGLLPPGGAQDCIEEKELSPVLAENVTELCNILTGLLNREEGTPRSKLHQVFLNGGALPADASAHLLALGRRVDLRVEVARYGGGRFSLALAG
ncbi:hypothetical protein [Micromonospora sp. NPDC049679]|uniref:hypothetical protein n=1 Tax=Micromonospora sp. NPDC049679 TaxID=3155920 RepID=UPI0033DA1E8B